MSDPGGRVPPLELASSTPEPELARQQGKALEFKLCSTTQTGPTHPMTRVRCEAEGSWVMGAQRCIICTMGTDTYPAGVSTRVQDSGQCDAPGRLHSQNGPRDSPDVMPGSLLSLLFHLCPTCLGHQFTCSRGSSLLVPDPVLCGWLTVLHCP